MMEIRAPSGIKLGRPSSPITPKKKFLGVRDAGAIAAPMFEGEVLRWDRTELWPTTLSSSSPLGCGGWSHAIARLLTSHDDQAMMECTCSCTLAQLPPPSRGRECPLRFVTSLMLCVGSITGSWSAQTKRDRQAERPSLHNRRTVDTEFSLPISCAIQDSTYIS